MLLKIEIKNRILKTFNFLQKKLPQEDVLNDWVNRLEKIIIDQSHLEKAFCDIENNCKEIPSFGTLREYVFKHTQPNQKDYITRQDGKEFCNICHNHGFIHGLIHPSKIYACRCKTGDNKQVATKMPRISNAEYATLQQEYDDLIEYTKDVPIGNFELLFVKIKEFNKELEKVRKQYIGEI